MVSYPSSYIHLHWYMVMMVRVYTKFEYMYHRSQRGDSPFVYRDVPLFKIQRIFDLLVYLCVHNVFMHA